MKISCWPYLGNGYSTKILKRLLREVQRARSRQRCKKGSESRHGRQKEREDRREGFLTLPYVDERLLWKVKHIIKRSKFRVHLAWKNENKLKKCLVRSVICKPNCPGGRKCHLCASGYMGDCTQKNVVYEISCKVCRQQGSEASYVGESMRPIRLRYNEHRRDALNKTVNTPFGDHFLDKHHSHDILSDTDFLALKILYRAQDHPDRKIAESITIRGKAPELNTQVSSWPIMRVVQ